MRYDSNCYFIKIMFLIVSTFWRHKYCGGNFFGNADLNAEESKGGGGGADP